VDINTVTWTTRLGVRRQTDDLALKKNIFAKSKDVKTGSNMAELPVEVGSSEMGSFVIIIIIIVIVIIILLSYTDLFPAHLLS
jgi:hypothetical protein